MPFTPTQQQQAKDNLDRAIGLLQNARTTVNASNTQFPVTTNTRAAIEALLDTLLLCGAALED